MARRAASYAPGTCTNLCREQLSMTTRRIVIARSGYLVAELLARGLAGHSECDSDAVPAAATGAGIGHPPGDECLVPARCVCGLGDCLQVLGVLCPSGRRVEDRKSTRLNSSHSSISYAVFCLK